MKHQHETQQARTAATLEAMSAMAVDGNAGWVTLPVDAY